jgi:hypothetical protein
LKILSERITTKYGLNINSSKFDTNGRKNDIIIVVKEIIKIKARIGIPIE